MRTSESLCDRDNAVLQRVLDFLRRTDTLAPNGTAFTGWESHQVRTKGEPEEQVLDISMDSPWSAYLACAVNGGWTSLRRF